MSSRANFLLKLRQLDGILRVKTFKDNFVIFWSNGNQTLIEDDVVKLLLSQKDTDIFLSVLNTLRAIDTMFEIKRKDVMLSTDKENILVDKKSFLEFLRDPNWVEEVLSYV